MGKTEKTDVVFSGGWKHTATLVNAGPVREAGATPAPVLLEIGEIGESWARISAGNMQFISTRSEFLCKKVLISLIKLSLCTFGRFG